MINVIEYDYEKFIILSSIIYYFNYDIIFLYYISHPNIYLISYNYFIFFIILKNNFNFLEMNDFFK